MLAGLIALGVSGCGADPPQEDVSRQPSPELLRLLDPTHGRDMIDGLLRDRVTITQAAIVIRGGYFSEVHAISPRAPWVVSCGWSGLSLDFPVSAEAPLIRPVVFTSERLSEDECARLAPIVGERLQHMRPD